MKKLLFMLTLLFVTTKITSNYLEPFTIQLESKWIDLENSTAKIKKFGGKWILAGSITFKKRSSETVYLDEIKLSWKGKTLSNLTGSLYVVNKTFLPIEKYLVCDSLWKASEQQLLLKFDKEHTLGARNTYYLVLTVPEDLEDTVKKGEFTIEKQSLPCPFQDYLQNNKIALSLNNAKPSITN